MKVPWIPLFAFGFAFSTASGQTPGDPAAATSPVAATASDEPTVGEVETFLVKIDAIIASREERATRLVNEMRAQDQRIETGIGTLREMLAKATDSPESKTRVSRLKREFITGLGKAAEAYARKRRELEESLRQTGNAYTREDLFKARGALDARVEKRVDDIMAVATTFDAHQDLEEYIYHPGGGDWNNGWDGVWEDNPAFEQNRRASRQGRQGRGEVVDGLNQSIERINLRLAALEQSVREKPTLPEPAQTERTAEMARLEKMRQQRAVQRDTLMSQPEPAATSEVGLKEAIRMDEEIETTAADLRQDFNALFNTFRDWQAVRAQLADSKARRDRAALWLEKEKATPAK